MRQMDKRKFSLRRSRVPMLIVVIFVLLITGFVIFEKIKDSTISQPNVGTAVLTGIVTKYPVSPTCDMSKLCSSPVTHHTIEAIDASGRVVATAQTDATGNYSFSLKPGHYTLKLVPQVGSVASVSSDIDIPAGSKQFNFSVDTGIR